MKNEPEIAKKKAYDALSIILDKAKNSLTAHETTIYCNSALQLAELIDVISDQNTSPLARIGRTK